MKKIVSYEDIGHSRKDDILWIFLDDHLQIVSAGSNRTHMGVWGVDTNIEECWRGRYEVRTGLCSIVAPESKSHLRRPPEWILSLLRGGFGVVEFHYFYDGGVDAFEPNPIILRKRGYPE